MRISIFLALLSLLTSATLRAEHPLGGPVPFSSRKQFADQLPQADPARRIGAIVRFRADGRDAEDEFREGLLRADTAATGNLRRLLQLVQPTDPSFDALRKQAADYRDLATAARTLVLTDHHKDKKKFEEMDKAFGAAEKAYDRLLRTMHSTSNSPAAQLVDALEWAAQVHRDLGFCDGKSADLAKLPIGEIMEIEGAPQPLQDFAKDLEPIISLREYERAVATAHTAARWAKAEQVQFANLLNSRRVVLQLRPLLLSQRLSTAAFGHSEEMVKLKYFAHESPVKENKTPWDRAKNAEFEGNAGGECIYAGGGSSTAAHTGWWYSDGHRLIMYGSGTCQGIARFGGGTWTFMTGTFSKYPL